VTFSTIKAQTVDDFKSSEEQWRTFVADLTELEAASILVLGVEAASIKVTTEAQADSRAAADEVARKLEAACDNEALQAKLGQCLKPFSRYLRYLSAPSPPPPILPPLPPSSPGAAPSKDNSAALAAGLTVGLLLLLVIVAYVCWRRDMLARCGLPYAPNIDERFDSLKSALNVRLYAARGATPTRLDADCNFNAPAKGSFAVSRLGLVRGAPSREQRRRITDATNKDQYGVRAAAGVRALEISKSGIEPAVGICVKSPRRGLKRTDSIPRRGGKSSSSKGGGDLSTEPYSETTDSARSDSPEFGRKNGMSVEEKAALEVRQQAMGYSQRALMRARKERKGERGRAVSEPAAHGSPLERKPSFMRAQRELLNDLKKIDSNAVTQADAETILGEPPREDNRSPKALAHDWLSRAMAASLVAEEEQEHGDPQKALARARGRHTTGGAEGGGGALARARAAKNTTSESGDKPGRTLSFKRKLSFTRRSARDSSPSKLSALALSPRGTPSDRTKSLLGAMRSNSFSRSLSFTRRTRSFGRKSKQARAPTQAELLRAAAASYAQNHRLNSRVPGSDGLDPTTSALFEARTLNVPLPPPLISPGHSSRQEEDTAAEAEEKDETAAAAPLAASGSDSPRACCGSSETPRRQRIKTPRRPISPGRQSAVQERVGRAKADSASRAKAAGGSVDPTTINARRKLEGMAEAVQIARQRSFSRLRISRDSGGAHLKPDGSGAWVVEPAASDHCVVDMDRVSAAADHAGGAAPDIAPKPIKWRAVGADTSAAASDAIKGPSPRQNKVLSI